MPILFSILRLAVVLGRWATKNSSLTPFQKKEAQALEELALELLDWRAEVRGAGKIDHALILTRSRKRFAGK